MNESSKINFVKYDKKYQTQLKKNVKLTNQQLKMKQKISDLKLNLKQKEDQESQIKNVLSKAKEINRIHEKKVGALFRRELSEDNLITNQGGNRLVRQYTAILEQAKNATSEKRLENQILKLQQDYDEL